MSDASKKNLMIGSIVGAIIIGGAALAMVVVSEGGKATAKTIASADPTSPNDYIQSDAFEKLSAEEKAQYFADNRDSLDHDLMRKLWEKRMNDMVNEWYDLPSDQREAYLDKKIDEGEKFFAAMRAQHEKDREEKAEEDAAKEDEDKNNEAKGGEHGRHAPSRTEVRDHVAERTEKQSPEQRAKAMAFFQAMMARRTARGMPNWGGPRGG